MGGQTDQGKVSTVTQIEGIPHFVYTAFGKSGEALYIGSSAQPRIRIAQHKATKEWWFEVDRVSVESFPSRGAALAEEKGRIAERQPKYNITYHSTNRAVHRSGSHAKRSGQLQWLSEAGAANLTTYDVSVKRDERWWMVQIPELDGLTQARRLGEVGLMAREWIAASTGASVDDVAVHIVSIEVPGVGDVAALARGVVAARNAAAHANEAAQRDAVAYVRALNDAGVPVRDTATLLEVAPQRISQLAKAI